MAKRKSKGGWPEDWREKIAGDDEEFLGALKEIADPVELGRLWSQTQEFLLRLRIGLNDLQMYNKPDASHSELRHAAMQSLNSIIHFVYDDAEHPEREWLKYDDGDPNFAFRRLFSALSDIDQGISVDWLKVDKPVDIDGNKPPGRMPASMEIRFIRGECAGYMELMNREGMTYDDAGAFIMDHLPEEMFKWIGDPRSKRSPKLVYRWLERARKVGTTEHLGFSNALDAPNTHTWQKFKMFGFTLQDMVGFMLPIIGNKAGIAPPDPNLEALE